MGEVWEAQDETLHRPVAVKVVSLLAGGGSNGDAARARFLREARLTARLQHPHIVTIHDLGETGTGGDRVPFLVMELVRGEGLDARLRRGAVPLSDVARWGAQICDALAGAHAAGITHRDVKPSNILVSPEGSVTVLDFGIAKAADPYATAERLTQTGFIVGTPPYMAPEQARGCPEPSSDLYAFGCLLFELITGRLPFQAPDTVGYLTAHLTQSPPAPSSVSPGIPPAWDDLVLTLLNKEPGDRYPDATALAQAMRALGRPLDDAPELARTAPLTVPAQRSSSQSSLRLSPQTSPRPAASGGLAATAAAVLALLCLPGILAINLKASTLRQFSWAPQGALWVHLLMGVLEALALATGAWLLIRRKPAGRPTIAAAGGAVALYGVNAGVELFGLHGHAYGHLTLAVPVVAVLTSVAAAAAVIAALSPSTGRWIAATPEESGRPGALAAATLALLCLPGFLTLVVEGAHQYSDRHEPNATILANVLVLSGEAVILVLGAGLLIKRKAAGRWIIATLGLVAIVHTLGLLERAETVGDPRTVAALTVFALAPLITAPAAGAVIMSLLPSTGRWCDPRR